MATFAAVILLCVGMYAVIVKRNILKMIIGLAVMGYAVNLLFLIAGYRESAGVPIADAGAAVTTVDPLAQAFVLTTVVLGLAMTILLAALALRLAGAYRTADVGDIRKLHG